MSAKTILLPVLVLTAVIGGPTSGAAGEYTIFSKAKAGKYQLVKMEFDGKTFPPEKSNWEVIYWPETPSIVGSGLSSTEDRGTFDSRVRLCPHKLNISEYRDTSDERAFHALWIADNPGQPPLFNNLSGLIEYKDNTIIFCFSCDDSGIPKIIERKGIFKDQDYPELPLDISSKKGVKSIIYYYKLVQ